MFSTKEITLMKTIILIVFILVGNIYACQTFKAFTFHVGKQAMADYVEDRGEKFFEVDSPFFPVGLWRDGEKLVFVGTTSNHHGFRAVLSQNVTITTIDGKSIILDNENGVFHPFLFFPDPQIPGFNLMENGNSIKWVEKIGYETNIDLASISNIDINQTVLGRENNVLSRVVSIKLNKCFVTGFEAKEGEWEKACSDFSRIYSEENDDSSRFFYNKWRAKQGHP